MIFGDGTPAFWPLAMVPAALAAGNVVDRSTDPVVDVLGAAQRVAEHEYNPTAAAVATCWRFRAAATRSDAFSASPVGAGQAFPLSVAGLGINTNPVCWNADSADVGSPTGRTCWSACARTSRSTTAPAARTRGPGRCPGVSGWGRLCAGQGCWYYRHPRGCTAASRLPRAHLRTRTQPEGSTRRWTGLAPKGSYPGCEAATKRRDTSSRYPE